jgi:predicted transcriptional regulator
MIVVIDNLPITEVAMGQTLPRIPDGEWAVLELLWEKGEASIRELARALYPRGGASEYATVHKFLERLEAKKCIRRHRRDGGYVIAATVGRDELIGRELTALMKKMGGDSLQPLLTNLVRVKGLTPEELRELLKLVDDLDEQKRPGRDRG